MSGASSSKSKNKDKAKNQRIVGAAIAASTASVPDDEADTSGSDTVLQKIRDITLDNSRPFSLEDREMPAKVLQIIDGDTVVLGIYLFRNRWSVRCRCARFNCAEMHSSSIEERTSAVRSRDYISQLMLNQVITAHFGANDKYGRALVDITLPDGRDLCQVMISGGYAAAYSGRGEKKY